jgi:hypothetical protein
LVSFWRIGLAALAIIDAVFHFLLHGGGNTGLYFLTAGVLFVLGAAFVLVSGSGILFSVGAYGLIALALIDNVLLYLTRTIGLRFLSSVMGGGGGFRPGGGNFTGRGNFTGIGNFTRPPGFNGTFTGRFGGGHGVPWSTTWIPPGAVQTFVLQVLIIVVAIAAIVSVYQTRKAKKPPPAPENATTPKSNS